MPTIHNKGKRKIVYPREFGADGKPVCDAKGKVISDFILPGKHKVVEQSIVKHLQSMFPNEIIDVNSITELQNHFQEKPEEVRRAGYLTPEEVEEEKKKAVAEAIKALATAKDGKNKPAPDSVKDMDRSELIDVIEQNNLPVEFTKLKNPEALRNAVISALQAA